MHAVLRLAAFAAVLALATAQPYTKGTRFHGYTYASNVVGYVNMTLDYCDMKNAIMSGNWSEALSIYTTGKNSFSGLTRRTFSTWATIQHPTEPTWQVLTAGKNESWIDNEIRAAFARFDALTVLGLTQVAVMKYMFHEVDQSVAKVQAYLVDPDNNPTTLNETVGVPHWVDEGFALWAGNNTEHCGTLASWANDTGYAMGTFLLGDSSVDRTMVAMWNDLLGYGRLADADAMVASRETMWNSVGVMGLQAMLKGIYAAQMLNKCGRPADAASEMTMGRAAYAYTRQILLAYDVDVSGLDAAMASDAPSYKRAYPAFDRVFEALGLQEREVGAPRFRFINEPYGCPKSAMPAV